MVKILKKTICVHLMLKFKIIYMLIIKIIQFGGFVNLRTRKFYWFHLQLFVQHVKGTVCLNGEQFCLLVIYF